MSETGGNKVFIKQEGQYITPGTSDKNIETEVFLTGKSQLYLPVKEQETGLILGLRPRRLRGKEMDTLPCQRNIWLIAVQNSVSCITALYTDHLY